MHYLHIPVPCSSQQVTLQLGLKAVLSARARSHTCNVMLACLKSVMSRTGLQAIKMKQHNPLPTWQEQGLCIGNTFRVTATNGLDIYRRINLMGYCRCTELLSDVVEHTVLSSGGEIVIREHKSSRLASLRLTHS